MRRRFDEKRITDIVIYTCIFVVAFLHSYAVGIIIVRRSVCTISTVHLERRTRLMDGVREPSRGST